MSNAILKIKTVRTGNRYPTPFVKSKKVTSDFKKTVEFCQNHANMGVFGIRVMSRDDKLMSDSILESKMAASGFTRRVKYCQKHPDMGICGIGVTCRDRKSMSDAILKFKMAGCSSRKILEFYRNTPVWEFSGSETKN